jgi:hypothetical protein
MQTPNHIPVVEDDPAVAGSLSEDCDQYDTRRKILIASRLQ